MQRQTLSERLLTFYAGLLIRLNASLKEILPAFKAGHYRHAVSVIAEVIGLLVIVIGVVVVLLVYGFFIGTYNATGGLNSTLTNTSPSTATTINNFFTTTTSVLGLLVLIPLVVIAGLVIFLIARFGGGGGE
jgi:uncharacterized protein YneF (UPF0154 family)